MSKITIPDNSILLLEGGSLRGLFTAGVLDTFMENDVYFPAVAGVSAGSLNALNYASHQPGRSASINLRYRHDSRYFGPKAALRGGSLFGLKFMLNDVKKEVPFDEETFAHGGMRVFAVATNVETGKPAYFEKGKTIFRSTRPCARRPACRWHPCLSCWMVSRTSTADAPAQSR